MGVAKGIRDDIERLIEQFYLEGRNVLELPEQLAVALVVGVGRKRKWGQISEYEILYREEDYSMEEIYARGGNYGLWKEFLEEVTIVKSRQLRCELLRLAESLLEEWPKLTPEDFSPLGEVMEYLLDAIFRKGNKNFLFTPVNIARFMVRLVQPDGGTLWDPACGSGTFLVEAVRGREEGENPSALFGTDINEQMRRIARINALFHGIKNARIVTEDALEEKRQFDVILANPPVSAGRGNDRFYGHIVPTAALHLQYLQMIPEHLAPGGRAAVLVNENVLFSKKSTETKIRKALVERYGLWAVISLPKGVFAPYTNAKSSIILFGGGRHREEILFYELHHLGYTLDNKHMEKEENDIPKAVAVCSESAVYYEKWDMALRQGSTFNADGVRIPEDWQEEDFWFADRSTVRENGYVLLPDRYRPQRPKEQEVQEDYRELLDRLFHLEREAGEQLEELKEIFQGDWI